MNIYSLPITPELLEQVGCKYNELGRSWYLPVLGSGRNWKDWVLRWEKGGWRYDDDHVWVYARGTEISFGHIKTIGQFVALYELWAGRPVSEAWNLVEAPVDEG